MASSAIKVLLGQGHPSRPKKGLTIGVACASGAVPPWLVDRTTIRYRGTSLMRTRHPVGRYSGDMPRAPSLSSGGGTFSYERGTTVR